MPRELKVGGTARRVSARHTEVTMNLPPGLFGGDKFNPPEVHPEKPFRTADLQAHDSLVVSIRYAIEGQTCKDAVRALSQVLEEVVRASNMRAGFNGWLGPVAPLP